MSGNTKDSPPTKAPERRIEMKPQKELNPLLFWFYENRQKRLRPDPK